MRQGFRGASVRLEQAVRVAAVLWCGCARPTARPVVPPPPTNGPLQERTAHLDAETPGPWPVAVATALAGHGEPHAQPIALPPDAQGRERWLAFVGTPEVSWGAWRVTATADGKPEIEPTEHWPAGARVLGGMVDDGIAYVLLESLGVLDQPAGLRAVWIDGAGKPSPFEASPMALAGVRELRQLATIERAPPIATPARTAALLSTLRAATASAAGLAGALATEGIDLDVVWQSLFAQRVGHLDTRDAASSVLGDRVLAILRDTLADPACGADACEVWTSHGRAIVRFAYEGGRWVVRAVFEDAPSAMGLRSTSPSREILANAAATETEPVLRARARGVMEVLGEAPLSTTGGTIGVALTDLAPDAPVIVLREGLAVRLFGIDIGATRGAGDARWEAAFVDADGDGRTDVVVRMSAKRADGAPLTWTEAFVAPPPSVQSAAVQADLASALAVLDAPTATAAAHAAASLPNRGVPRDEACRLLATAGTPAGFRRAAAPDARVLHFSEPGMPTWRPKVIPLTHVTPDDVRGVGAHCAELECSSGRPYCAWTGGADSQHYWFDWRGEKLEIAGAADYDGE